MSCTFVDTYEKQCLGYKLDEASSNLPILCAVNDTKIGWSIWNLSKFTAPAYPNKKIHKKKFVCIERSDTELSGCIKIISVRNQKTVNIDKNLSAN